MKRTTITTEHDLVLSAEKLREILVASGVNLPADAQLSFRIPYSGDFRANETLYLHDTDGLHIEWTTTKTKEEP